MSRHGTIARVRATMPMAVAATAAAVAALAVAAPAQADNPPPHDPAFGVTPPPFNPAYVATLDGERVKTVLAPGGNHVCLLSGGTGSHFVSCDPDSELPMTQDPHKYQLGWGPYPSQRMTDNSDRCGDKNIFPYPTLAMAPQLSGCFAVSFDLALSTPGLWGYIAPPTAQTEDGDPVIFHDWTIRDGLVDGFCGTGNIGYRFTNPFGEFRASYPEWIFARGIAIRSYMGELLSGQGTNVIYELLYAPASPDVTKPIVTVNTPRDCAHFAFGQAVTVDYECDDLGSGVATCAGTRPDGAALDTSRLGERRFTVTGTDNQGHARTRTVRYFVEGTYGFTGFAAPIDNGYTNTAKAGQAIPVKYRLTTPDGAPVSDPASFVSLTSQSGGGSCAGLPADAIETYTGSSGLQYLGDGNWQFNWKTPKNYTGQCRTMTLTLNDDSTHTAAFSFK